MDLSTIANLATALTVLVGAGFGLLELRRVRREREERAAFAAVRAIMTPEWIRSVVIVQSLPDDISLQDLEANPRALEAAHSIGIILEALGYSVYSRIVPLLVVDELIGGVVRLAWQKLRSYIEAERQRARSLKSWEWFQWLAEQLARHTPGKADLNHGAYEVYRDWRP